MAINLVFILSTIFHNFKLVFRKYKNVYDHKMAIKDEYDSELDSVMSQGLQVEEEKV